MKLRWMAVLIIVVIPVACGNNDGGHASGLNRIKAYANAQVRIEHLRKQKEPDWVAIETQYELAAPIVKEVDEYSSSTYEAEIRQALDKCSFGDRVKVNQQVVAKGLQHVTVLAMSHELDAMGRMEPSQRKEAVKRVAAYFEGIRPTFCRRDRDYFGGRKNLEAGAERAINGLTRAAEMSPAKLLSARRELEEMIARTYALCVLFEVSEIEKYLHRNLGKCDVKRKEAEIFFRIVQTQMLRRDPKAAEALAAMLRGPYGGMSSKATKKYFLNGLPGVALELSDEA